MLKTYQNQIFMFNAATKEGLDIISKDKTIGAEVFASVKKSNNNKINKDIKKLENCTKKIKDKYLFYYLKESKKNIVFVNNINEKMVNEIKTIQFENIIF